MKLIVLGIFLTFNFNFIFEINNLSLASAAMPIIQETDRDEKNERKRIQPVDIPNLIAFWDFQEKKGRKRVSKGQYSYALEEMNGPIKRVKDGVFGPYSADIVWGQWFRAKRKDIPALNLHGKQQVTMIAWIKPESDRVWQYIAGMWDEGSEEFRGKPHGKGKGAPSRQYAIFISGAWQCDYTTYERTRAKNQTHGYISSTGGATHGSPFAFDYATGETQLEKNHWYMIAYTYDGETIKVYVNGKLDSNGNYNPFIFDGRIYDGGDNGSDFTVALRHVPGWPAYPESVPENDAGFDGRIGGLAIYNRALFADEIDNLYKSTIK